MTTTPKQSLYQQVLSAPDTARSKKPTAMPKPVHFRLIVIGAILAVAGFVAKIGIIKLPDWIGCASLALGLAMLIFAIGSRNARTLRQ